MSKHVKECDTGTCDECGADVTCEADTEAKIVAWLRSERLPNVPYLSRSAAWLAKAIERGDHR